MGGVGEVAGTDVVSCALEVGKGSEDCLVAGVDRDTRTVELATGDGVSDPPVVGDGVGLGVEALVGGCTLLVGSTGVVTPLESTVDKPVVDWILGTAGLVDWSVLSRLVEMTRITLLTSGMLVTSPLEGDGERNELEITVAVSCELGVIDTVSGSIVVVSTSIDD